MEQSTTKFFNSGEQKLSLKSGQDFGPYSIAYETYGQLNQAKDNAVLVFHALSGSQHASGKNSEIEGVENL